MGAGNYMCQWQLTHAELDIPDEEEEDNFIPDTDDEADTNDVAESTKLAEGLQ